MVWAMPSRVAGELLVLQPGVTHQVEALEVSVFLLTVADFRGGPAEEP
jgi:quercetin dioxygenase-like cupin family protein